VRTESCQALHHSNKNMTIPYSTPTVTKEAGAHTNREGAAQIGGPLVVVNSTLFDLKRSSHRLRNKIDQLGDRLDNLEDAIDQNHQELVGLLRELIAEAQGLSSPAV